MNIKNYVDDNDVIHFSLDGKETFSMEERADENGKTFRILLRGSLSNALAYAFRDELSILASVNADIILEAAELTYIGNMCVEALVDVQQQMDQYGKGTLTLTGVPPAIMDTLKSMGVPDLLMIE